MSNVNETTTKTTITTRKQINDDMLNLYSSRTINGINSKQFLIDKEQFLIKHQEYIYGIAFNVFKTCTNTYLSIEDFQSFALTSANQYLNRFDPSAIPQNYYANAIILRIMCDCKKLGYEASQGLRLNYEAINRANRRARASSYDNLTDIDKSAIQANYYSYISEIKLEEKTVTAYDVIVSDEPLATDLIIEQEKKDRAQEVIKYVLGPNDYHDFKVNEGIEQRIKYYDIYVDHYLNEMSIGEIAEKYGTNYKSIDNYLNRINNALKSAGLYIKQYLDDERTIPKIKN